MECASFLPGAAALSFFGVNRRLLAVILNVILDSFVQWLDPDILVQEAVKMVTSHSHWLTAQLYCPLLFFKP